MIKKKKKKSEGRSREKGGGPVSSAALRLDSISASSVRTGCIFSVPLMGKDNVQSCSRSGGSGAATQQGVLGNEAVDADRSLAPLLWDEQGHPQTGPWKSNKRGTKIMRTPRSLHRHRFVN